MKAPPQHKTPHRPSRRDDRRAFDQQRRKEQPWRAWYGTARWQKLRWSVLVRDLFRCQMCGRIEADSSELVADHVHQHNGDPNLFWHGDLRCICKLCHDSDKQAMERSGKPRRQRVGADGWPVE